MKTPGFEQSLHVRPSLTLLLLSGWFIGSRLRGEVSGCRVGLSPR